MYVCMCMCGLGGNDLVCVTCDELEVTPKPCAKSENGFLAYSNLAPPTIST